MGLGMESVGEFLAMGGYAQFVWPSYGLTAAVLVSLLALSRKFMKSSEAELKRLREGDTQKEDIGEA